MESNISIEKTIVLLQSVEGIVKTHEKDAIERGEDFNLFTVMGMEHNETFTHSAIIAALLQPKGNHYMGFQFLELFLKQLGYKHEGEDLKHTKVYKEFHIGKIDDTYDTGGFIDILIQFSSGKTLAIENKIYAGDQPKQLHRYFNYNKENTYVYYLTLFGTEPSKNSSQDLEEGKHYDLIAYNRQILDWLEACYDICKKDSTVKTSLQQYIILVKKLTNTLENRLEMELREAIIGNLKEAKYISNNYQSIVFNIREQFRQAILHEVRNRLDSEIYAVTEGNTPDYHYSQIWVHLKKTHTIPIHFGIESFSGKGNNDGCLFVGILDHTKKYSDINLISSDRNYNNWWPVIRNLTTPEGNRLHLGSDALLEKLAAEKLETFKQFVEKPVSDIVEFIGVYTTQMIKIHEVELKLTNT